MSDRVLQVELVSHEGRLWHGTGTAVRLPLVDGALGVLPGRQPLLAQLDSGELSVTTAEGEKTFTISGGFASVDSDFVTVVADRATVS